MAKRGRKPTGRGEDWDVRVQTGVSRDHAERLTRWRKRAGLTMAAALRILIYESLDKRAGPEPGGESQTA